MKTIQVGRVVSEGGRDGRVHSLDEGFALSFARDDAAEVTPEHLFAAAYAACFHTALKNAADQAGTTLANSTVTAHAQLKQDFQRRQELSVELRVHLPGVSGSEAERLLDQANENCPYAKATRGNIRVDLWLD